MIALFIFLRQFLVDRKYRVKGENFRRAKETHVESPGLVLQGCRRSQWRLWGDFRPVGLPFISYCATNSVMRGDLTKVGR